MFVIRQLGADDRAAWGPLYCDYGKAWDEPFDKERLDSQAQRLYDKIAERDDNIYYRLPINNSAD